VRAKFCQRVWGLPEAHADLFPEAVGEKAQLEALGRKCYGNDFIGVGEVTWDEERGMWTANVGFWKEI
jgi:hypothetical protein